MSLKTLITFLILGSSSVALAKPVLISDGVDGRAYPPAPPVTTTPYDTTDYYNDHRSDFDNDRGRWFMRRPITIANDVVLSPDPRLPARIVLDPRMGAFKRLRLDVQTGRMFINAVVLQLADGHTQTVLVRQILSPRNPSIMINLDHPGVRSIQIYGSSFRGRGSFDVVALRGPRFAPRYNF